MRPYFSEDRLQEDLHEARRSVEERGEDLQDPQQGDGISHLMRWLAALDDFRNWLGWAPGPRNAMKIGAAE